jgi:hypothetical protein
MELRLLTMEADRRIFAHRMEDARASRGVAHFRETRKSNMGKVHLDYGQLYALFENDNQPAEAMMSGFIMHDTASFPQSYPKPDLTHYFRARCSNAANCGRTRRAPASSPAAVRLFSRA